MARFKLIFGVLLFFFGFIVIVLGWDPTRNFGKAKVTYCNNKYFLNCTVVSFNKKIGGVSRSFTNVSLYTMVPMNNNVTVSTIYVSEKGFTYKNEHKFCDYTKHPWLREYLSLYQKYTKIMCPFGPGLFELNNMEVPPPILIVPLQPGEYQEVVDVYHTKTKERLMKMANLINIARKERSKKKRKH